MSKIIRKITIEGDDNSVEFTPVDDLNVYIFVPDTDYDAKLNGYGFGVTVAIDKLVEVAQEIKQWQRDKEAGKLFME